MRVGVIGLGTIGQTHLAALRHLGVAWIYGADPSAAARERAAAIVSRAFADYREMLSGAELDAVIVATPPRTHREISLAALQAGVAVLCEKPLALTLEECEAVADAAAGSHRPFLVGFCHRFQPQVRALKDLLDAGALGQPVLATISFTHGLTEQGREWIVDPTLAGGGVLFDSGSHAIDLFRYLVGELDDVGGLTVGDLVEDVCIACLRSDGVLGTIALSWKTPPWHGAIEVIGSAARARVEYDDDRVRLLTRANGAPWKSVRTSREDRFVAELRHFLACVRGEEAPLTSARDGLEATRAILRIYGDRPTSGTRGSFSVSGHFSRTQAISGSSDAAMVRRSPARKLR
jgi:predicted dehydrogenase